MNTILKIALGFVLGAVCTVGVLHIIGIINNKAEYQLREEIRMQTLKDLQQLSDENVNALKQLSNEYDNALKDNQRISDKLNNTRKNIQSFELTTKNGIVKLHTYMSKDSVQILMGRPQSTDINDYGFGEVIETWKYKGTNRYVDEFTIKFANGKLKSVRQFKDH
ncbi:hypothetical protein [Tamlana flava]|uniref:hypothetical protein n=1 Tax=Tamlana flava TaxID=3158572 RepID=UPI00351AE6AD